MIGDRWPFRAWVVNCDQYLEANGSILGMSGFLGSGRHAACELGNRAEYHGFAGTRSAEMIVSVEYLSPGTKGFTIQSSTGSKLIIDKVFKKLMEAEKRALGADVQRRAALTEDNYRFTLVRYEHGQSGILYVLAVEPRTKDKFLYRGKSTKRLVISGCPHKTAA